MAVTRFQRTICRLIASHRIESGVSYVAGGVALNTLTRGERVSRDIDIFNDTREAVEVGWLADRESLTRAGFEVKVLRERQAFVEAVISGGDGSVILQWTQDSAYRFFPLIEHEDFGLALHPFDLATNKVLALVGRVEARDWVDTLGCHDTVQRLGYLAWAASGKDPGFSPTAILEQAGRSARYSNTEVGALSFSGAPPDAAALSKSWHAMLEEGRRIVSLLPAREAGKCVLDSKGELFSGSVSALARELESASLAYHEGRLRGSWPQLV